MFWKVMAIAGFFLLCLIAGGLSRLADNLDKIFKALDVTRKGEEAILKSVIGLIDYEIKNKRKFDDMMPLQDPL